MTEVQETKPAVAKPAEGWWNGRLTRGGFIGRSLIAAVSGLMLNLFAEATEKASNFGTVPEATSGVAVILLVLSVLLSIWVISIARRRLNDIKENRWHAVWLFVPIGNLILWVYLATAKSVDD